MSATPIKQEIVEELEKLTPELQLQVLNFVRKLRLSPAEGVPGRELLPFAGILTPEEAELMERATEEGCERVDQGEW